MVRLASQCGREPIETGSVGRQPKSQQVIGPVEITAPDMPLCQFSMKLRSLRMPGEPEQWRASGDRKTRVHQHVVEGKRLPFERAARAVRPWLIPERCGPDPQRWPGTWPRPQCRSDPRDDLRCSDGESQPQPCEPVKLSERPQDHHRQIGAQRGRADVWIDVCESLVDDQPAAASFQLRSEPRERVTLGDAAIGVVGIDHDRMDRAFRARIETVDCDDRVTGVAPGERVFAIGRSDDRDRTRRSEIRQQLNQRLGSAGSGKLDIIGQAIGLARSRVQRFGIGARRQALPDAFRQTLRNWPWPGADPGRQIQPAFGEAAMPRDRLGKVTTMLHARFLPSSVSKREGARTALLMISSLVWLGMQGAVHAAGLPRIASINLCTDQLLVTLADPAQILGLSPYSRDRARSWDAEKAAQFPKLSGEAEDVLVLEPDVVVAGRFTKRATRELLKEKGLRVVEFDAARSLDDVKKQIRQMGDLVQHPDRAAAEIKRLDDAIAHAREVVARKPYRVLALSRRGWVSGGDSLISSLLAATGLSNAAVDLGFKLGGFASLETIVSLRPDFLLVSNDGDFAEDLGSAFLLHPALERFYPASKRLVIPEKLTVCGGPLLSEALDRLSSELERVTH